MVASLEDHGPRFEGLGALFINCTLKRSPEPSNTDGLIELSSGIMRRRGVEVDEWEAGCQPDFINPEHR